MSAEVRFLLVRVAGIVLGVPIVFVIVTFGVDSIFYRHDPAGDVMSMRYVMVGLIVCCQQDGVCMNYGILARPSKLMAQGVKKMNNNVMWSAALGRYAWIHF